MSENAFAKGVVHPALFVGGCIFSGLFLLVVAFLALSLVGTLFGQSTESDLFGDPAANLAAYTLCLFSTGGLGLAMLRGSGVKWVSQVPVLRDVPTWALVAVGVAASLPILLFVALIISIIAGGGLD